MVGGETFVFNLVQGRNVTLVGFREHICSEIVMPSLARDPLR